MSEIQTEILLSAPAERIWTLITDFNLYSHWNPLFQKGTGCMNVGEHLDLTVHLPGITPFTITPKVLTVEPSVRFGWRHTTMSSALLTWEYAIELESLGPEHLKFVQKSRFGGLAGPLFSLALGRPVTEGLLGLNEAVRRWGEKGNVCCLKC
jgi:hypothetical protein